MDSGRNFTSDNVAPIAPEIMQAMVEANSGKAPAYGNDALTAELNGLMRDLFEHEVTVFPIATGTATNAMILAQIAGQTGAIYCHEDAHITSSEAGAPEFYSGGARVIGLNSRDGKLVPAMLAQPVARAIAHGVHQSRPAAITISQAHEWGGVYRPDEVAALSEFGRANGIKLHMDGARFGNAVAHLGCSPAEITWKAGLSALSFGATKNGGMAAEAAVFFDADLAARFEWRRKQGGHLWSKARFLSVQLIAYLQNGLWLRNATRANRAMQRLSTGLASIPGISLSQPVEANEAFPVMPEALIAGLRAEGFTFHDWIVPMGMDLPAGSRIVRLICSYDTEDDDIDAFIAAAWRLAGSNEGR